MNKSNPMCPSTLMYSPQHLFVSSSACVTHFGKQSSMCSGPFSILLHVAAPSHGFEFQLRLCLLKWRPPPYTSFYRITSAWSVHLHYHHPLASSTRYHFDVHMGVGDIAKNDVQRFYIIFNEGNIILWFKFIYFKLNSKKSGNSAPYMTTFYSQC